MLMYKKAFSLVELLVAIILLSLLIGLAVFSFKYQLIAVTNIKKSGIDSIIKYNQIKSSLESIKYYLVDRYDNLNRPMKNLHYYFNGSSKEVNYITRNPLFSTDIAIARLSCKDNKLIYQEEKLYGKIDFLRPTIPQESRAYVFYTNLNECTFQYISNNVIFDNFVDNIPSSIKIKLSLDNNTFEIYTNVKSDNNQTKSIISSLIYEQK